MKYLYARKKETFNADLNENVEVKVFKPGIFNGFMLSGEKKNLKTILFRATIQISALGKARVFYVTDGEKLVHTSMVIPKCGKFTFMNEADYEIGPCLTYPEYRGKGIYPAVINHICNSIGRDGTLFYMIVDETNTASIKGIEKAKFERCGSVDVTGITKKYKANKL